MDSQELASGDPADHYADYWANLAINRGDLDPNDAESVISYRNALRDQFASSGAPEHAVNPDMFAGAYDQTEQGQE